VTGKATSLDPWFQVRDQEGTQLVENWCAADRSGGHHSPCSVASELVAETDGVWTFFLADAGADGTGDYEVSFNCIVGNCPRSAVSPPTHRLAQIEHPGDLASGVSGVGGWMCGPHGVITAVFDDGQPLVLATALPRGDTAAPCDNGGRNGFFGVFNYALLGAGRHRVRFFEDGVEFADREFEVGTLGRPYEPFARGLVGECVAADFPSAGKTTVARWSEAVQGFVLE
jgi:hypothetical protein